MASDPEGLRANPWIELHAVQLGTLLAGTQEEKAHLETQCHLFRI